MIRSTSSGQRMIRSDVRYHTYCKKQYGYQQLLYYVTTAGTNSSCIMYLLQVTTAAVLCIYCRQVPTGNSSCIVYLVPTAAVLCTVAIAGTNSSWIIYLLQVPTAAVLCTYLLQVGTNRQQQLYYVPSTNSSCLCTVAISGTNSSWIMQVPTAGTNCRYQQLLYYVPTAGKYRTNRQQQLYYVPSTNSSCIMYLLQVPTAAGRAVEAAAGGERENFQVRSILYYQ